MTSPAPKPEPPKPGEPGGPPLVTREEHRRQVGDPANPEARAAADEAAALAEAAKPEPLAPPEPAATMSDPSARPYPAVKGGFPNIDVAWPPQTIRPALDRMGVWDAWWSRDPQRLASVYGPGIASTATRPDRFLSGGVAGAWRRFWWGKQPAGGEQQSKLHVPLGADIVRGSANLLFSEPIKVTCDDPQATARYGQLLDEENHAKLLESAELGAALGGYYLTPAHNRELAEQAWIDAVPPDQAWPEWSGGRLRAVTFWRIVGETNDGAIVWRHLERHEPGWTLHALYEGDTVRLGHPVPFTERPETEHLADYVGKLGEVATGYPRLACVYIPNMRPWPLFRSDAVLAPYGQPDLDGIEGLLDAMDETYADWMRDLRLAKARLLVPQDYLESNGPGRGASFDGDREVFTPINYLAEGNGTSGASGNITAAQFDIRVQEHKDTAAALKAAAVEGAGYDPATFGENTDGGQAITATEVKSRQRRTYTTRDRKIAFTKPQLRRFLPALAAIDAAVYGRPMPDLATLPMVEFPDGVSDDVMTLAGTAEVLSRAAAASTETLVRLVHPDWDEAQVLEEVDKIGEQNAPPPIELLGPDGFPIDPPADEHAPGDEPSDDDSEAPKGDLPPTTQRPVKGAPSPVPPRGGAAAA